VRKGGSVKVAIVGSRNYPHPESVIRFVEQLAAKYPDAIVVSGGARGVDSIAEEAAERSGLSTLIFPADWARHGRRAGYLRNEDIIAAADIVVGFWDGESRGTQHSLDLAIRAGKQLFVYGRSGHLMVTRDASGSR
jgi:hypothetical protein